MKLYKLNINKQYLTLISNKHVSSGEDIKFPLIDKKYFTSTSISTTSTSTSTSSSSSSSSSTSTSTSTASTLPNNVSFSSWSHSMINQNIRQSKEIHVNKLKLSRSLLGKGKFGIVGPRKRRLKYLPKFFKIKNYRKKYFLNELKLKSYLRILYIRNVIPLDEYLKYLNTWNFISHVKILFFFSRTNKNENYKHKIRIPYELRDYPQNSSIKNFISLLSYSQSQSPKRKYLIMKIIKKLKYANMINKLNTSEINNKIKIWLLPINNKKNMWLLRGLFIIIINKINNIININKTCHTNSKHKYSTLNFYNNSSLISKFTSSTTDSTLPTETKTETETEKNKNILPFLLPNHNKNKLSFPSTCLTPNLTSQPQYTKTATATGENLLLPLKLKKIKLKLATIFSLMDNPQKIKFSKIKINTNIKHNKLKKKIVNKYTTIINKGKIALNSRLFNLKLRLKKNIELNLNKEILKNNNFNQIEQMFKKNLLKKSDKDKNKYLSDINLNFFNNYNQKLFYYKKNLNVKVSSKSSFFNHKVKSKLKSKNFDLIFFINKNKKYTFDQTKLPVAVASPHNLNGRVQMLRTPSSLDPRFIQKTTNVINNLKLYKLNLHLYNLLKKISFWDKNTNIIKMKNFLFFLILINKFNLNIFFSFHSNNSLNNKDKVYLILFKPKNWRLFAFLSLNTIKDLNNNFLSFYHNQKKLTVTDNNSHDENETVKKFTNKTTNKQIFSFHVINKKSNFLNKKNQFNIKLASILPLRINKIYSFFKYLYKNKKNIKINNFNLPISKFYLPGFLFANSYSNFICYYNSTANANAFNATSNVNPNTKTKTKTKTNTNIKTKNKTKTKTKNNSNVNFNLISKLPILSVSVKNKKNPRNNHNLNPNQKKKNLIQMNPNLILNLNINKNKNKKIHVPRTEKNKNIQTNYNFKEYFKSYKHYNINNNLNYNNKFNYKGKLNAALHLFQLRPTKKISRMYYWIRKHNVTFNEINLKLNNKWRKNNIKKLNNLLNINVRRNYNKTNKLKSKFNSFINHPQPLLPYMNLHSNNKIINSKNNYNLNSLWYLNFMEKIYSKRQLKVISNWFTFNNKDIKHLYFFKFKIFKLNQFILFVEEVLNPIINKFNKINKNINFNINNNLNNNNNTNNNNNKNNTVINSNTNINYNNYINSNNDKKKENKIDLDSNFDIYLFNYFFNNYINQWLFNYFVITNNFKFSFYSPGSATSTSTSNINNNLDINNKFFKFNNNIEENKMKIKETFKNLFNLNLELRQKNISFPSNNNNNFIINNYFSNPINMIYPRLIINKKKFNLDFPSNNNFLTTYEPTAEAEAEATEGNINKKRQLSLIKQNFLPRSKRNNNSYNFFNCLLNLHVNENLYGSVTETSKKDYFFINSTYKKNIFSVRKNPSTTYKNNVINYHNKINKFIRGTSNLTSIFTLKKNNVIIFKNNNKIIIKSNNTNKINNFKYYWKNFINKPRVINYINKLYLENYCPTFIFEGDKDNWTPGISNNSKFIIKYLFQSQLKWNINKINTKCQIIKFYLDKRLRLFVCTSFLSEKKNINNHKRFNKFKSNNFKLKINNHKRFNLFNLNNFKLKIINKNKIHNNLTLNVKNSLSPTDTTIRNRVTVRSQQMLIHRFLKFMSIYNLDIQGTFLYFNRFIAFNFNLNRNKLIKEIYDILFFAFKSMSCLISKPVFSFKTDKIIIHLFYFLISPAFLKFNRPLRNSLSNIQKKKTNRTRRSPRYGERSIVKGSNAQSQKNKPYERRKNFFRYKSLFNKFLSY